MAYSHSAEQQTADRDAAKKGKCPECGKALAKGDGKFHVVEHWPRHEDLKLDTDAARRARLVLAIDRAEAGE